MYKFSIPLGVLTAIIAIAAYMVYAGASLEGAVEFFSGTFLFALIGVLVAFSILVSVLRSFYNDGDIEEALKEI